MKKNIIIALCFILTLTAFVGCTSNQSSEPSSSVIEEKDKQQFTRMIPPQVFAPKKNLSFDFLGISFDLPDLIREQCIDEKIVMDGDFKVNEQEKRLEFATVKFMFMDENYTDEIEFVGLDENWKAQAFTPYTIGVYHKDYLSSNTVETITGKSENTEIGAQGDYLFYVSTEDVIPEKAQALYDTVKSDFDTLTKNITVTIPQPLVSKDKYCIYERAKSTEASIGEFDVKDINGVSFNEEIFAENELTLVNLYTTWCSPCVKEIPHLDEISKEMDNVGVVGFVLDVIDPVSGLPSNNKIDIAKKIAEKTGATYPMLIPDENLMDGRLRGVTSYPESFFVDKDGNIVGETIIGAKNKEEWIDIINKTLEELNQ